MMLCTKKPIFSIVLQGLAPCLEEDKPDQSPRAQLRLVDWL